MSAMMVCETCGAQHAEGRFCRDCGGTLRAPVSAARGGVSTSKGDTGVDRSRLKIDNSQHSSNQTDRHDVHTTTVTNDASQHHIVNHTHVNQADGGPRALWYGVLILVVIVVALLVRSLLISTPAPAPATVIVNVPPGGSAPGPVTSAPGTNLNTTPASRVTNGGGAGSRPGGPAASANRPDSPPAPGAGGGSAPAAMVPPAVPKLDPSLFVNRGAVRPGSVSVLMIDARRGMDAMLTQQVAALVDGTDGLFKPAFVQDGLFTRVHQGDMDLLQELGITAEVDRILLGTRTVTFSPTELAGQALVRASVTLNVRVVRPSSGFTSSPATASDVGAGFDEEAAAALATDNALKKLVRALGR